MDSKPVDVNVGRFGLSKQQLIEQAYERLTVSATIAGFSLGPLSADGVEIFDPQGDLFKKVNPEELITLRGLLSLKRNPIGDLTP